jgi:hypothetical protein
VPDFPARLAKCFQQQKALRQVQGNAKTRSLGLEPVDKRLSNQFKNYIK